MLSLRALTWADRDSVTSERLQYRVWQAAAGDDQPEGTPLQRLMLWCQHLLWDEGGHARRRLGQGLARRAGGPAPTFQASARSMVSLFRRKNVVPAPATAPPWGLMPVLRRARWGVFRCGEPPLQLVPLGSSPQLSTDHRGHRLQEPQDCSPGWAASPSYNHRSHGREPADAGSPQPAPAPWRHTDWREEVFCAPLAGGGRPRGPQRDRVRREAVLACVDELQGCCAAVSTGLPPHCSQ